MIFRIFKNPQKLQNQSTLGRPRSHLKPKAITFGFHFGIDFSTFCRKGRKCEISEEYNAKRGSEASKTFDFRIVFSLFSCFCSNPLLELIFRGGLRRSIHKSVFFIGFWTPAGSQNVCFELHFRQSGVKKRSTPNGPERPGADLGAIWRRKRSKDAFLFDLVRF